MEGTTPDLGKVGDLVRSHLPSSDYRVFLFGSRARGEGGERSDWDIGILGPEDLPGYVLQRIHADLEQLPTLHRFDVVDLHAASAPFRTRALTSTKPL